ncbi:MAG: YgiQ family radical SAM protein [Lachnospiraceae bacterium]|nr:YgiQ family radical SAM protein [Lachnospiraceae bacterium]
MPGQGFLPICREDMEKRGIRQFDFVYVIGDAYVDHPSFGHAIISRLLEAYGYTVGIISQPDWRQKESVAIYGEPRLAFLVSAGNMDSMVNHYSVSKRRREKDSFTPGGVMGRRPDYATVVYGNLIRQTYKKTPILIGGVEASLRRLAHYDYWSGKVKRSILLDSGADILMYGMGERSMIQLAEALDSGLAAEDITFVEGTVCKVRRKEDIYDAVFLPPYASVREDRECYAKSFYTQYCNADPFHGKRLAEEYPNQVYVVQNPPSKPLSQQEMDDVYGLPYQRAYHPSYEAQGGVPAISEVKFSITSNRGCFGGCSFCALTFHQGRIVQSRSHASILKEAKLLLEDADFKGYIHDVGGPTANFRYPACEKQLQAGACVQKQCLFPKPCQNLRADHKDYLELLRKLRSLPGVRKVFIRSGIRFDYLLADADRTFLRELCEYHVSGQLKVAPEHISDKVLHYMGKPRAEVYERFAEEYRKMNETLGKKQYLVPYLMSSHPGSTLREAVELAEFLRDLGYMPQQVQDFYPTPSTISTCMYYTGLDPRTMKKVYVAHNPHEKAMQRALIQYREERNYELVKEALVKTGRTDLIGFGAGCLIAPRKGAGGTARKGKKGDLPGKGKEDVRGKGKKDAQGKKGDLPGMKDVRGKKSPRRRGRGSVK